MKLFYTALLLTFITSTFQYRYENLEINNFEAIAPELPQVKNNYDFHPVI